MRRAAAVLGLAIAIIAAGCGSGHTNGAASVRRAFAAEGLTLRREPALERQLRHRTAGPFGLGGAMGAPPAPDAVFSNGGHLDSGAAVFVFVFPRATSPEEIVGGDKKALEAIRKQGLRYLQRSNVIVLYAKELPRAQRHRVRAALRRLR